MLEQAKDLNDGGFAIHWLHPLSKRPIGNDWASKPVADKLALARTYVKGNNIGVRLGKWSDLGGWFLHIVDVDIRDSDLADDAIKKLREMLPEFDFENAPAVISGSGGESRHFYLITDKPFPSRKFAHSPTFQMIWDSAKGRDVKHWDWELHLIGTGGQAAIPPSIHPDTKKPYRWLRQYDHLDLTLGSMPTVPAEAVERLIGYEDLGEVDPERLKPLGLSVDELREYLDELDYEAWFEDRDGWFRTGMAISHETKGSKAGFELWCEYSKRSEKFDRRDAKRVWNSFKGRTERPFRFASVVAVVNDIRMEQDFEDYGADGGDDLGEFDDFGEDISAGMFDDLLGDPNPKLTRSQTKLAKQGVEEKLGKPAPPWVVRMNDKHAIARIEGKTVVLDFKYDGGVAYGSVNDMHAFYENDRRPKDDTTVPVSKVWIQHPKRRTYRNGIVFAPNRDVEGAYNHWQGFSVDASKTASCQRFLDHMRDVFCSGNEEHYQYLIRWMGHLVQRPEEKPGVAIVARGKKGVGKDTPFEYLGRMFDHHYITVANQDQMTGKFNSHQERCLLLHMQEGFWAGNKSAESALKYLITSESVMIEPKGVNAFKVNSVLRLYISSNERWVVPASDDERRFFVLNVSDIRRGQHTYFAKLREEMHGDGPAALLHYLQNLDLTDFQVRAVPDTAALGDQKLQGLKNVEKWWFAVLQEGAVEGTQESDENGPDLWERDSIRIDRKDIYEQYERWMQSRRYEGEVMSMIAFKKEMTEMMPLLKVVRGTVRGTRPYLYVVPPLHVSRQQFEEKIGSQVDWPTVDGIEEPEDDLG